jgi:hypothetical protein
MTIRLSPRGARPAVAVVLAAASLVLAAAAGSIFLSTARDGWLAITAAGPAAPADGILLVVALGGGLMSLWLGLGMALSALSALPGALGQACTGLAGRIAPSAVRKVVSFILGTTLTAALVPGTAIARTGQEGPRPAVVAAARHAVSGLGDAAPDASFRFISGPMNDGDAAPPPSWSNEQPPPIELVSRGAAPANSLADGIVVHRGDTLWSIATRHLGPAATTADVEAEWHRWFAFNRDVIGDDANLIHAGQRLVPPASLKGNP